MLRPLLAVLCLLPISLATKCCSGEDRRIVLHQWYSAYNSKQSGDFKVTLGLALFDKFLKEAPGAAEPLKRVHPGENDNPEWKAHTIRVAQGIDRVLNLLDNSKALEADLHHLAVQHEERTGVTKAQFGVMGKVLRETLPTVLTEYNADAWNSCLKLLGDGITARLA